MRILPLLILNSVLLAAATIFFAMAAARYIDFRKTLISGIGRINRHYYEKRLQSEVKKYTRNASVKMTLQEKAELFLIDKSNIRHYIPIMNFNMLFVICACIFLAALKPVYKIVYFVPTTLIVSLLFSLVPLLILDIMGRYNSEKIRKRLAEFISVLNRWCAVKEDIFYAFEKSLDSGIGEPLRTFIRDMTIQVKRGIDPLEALEILHFKVDNTQFRDFVVNVKQNIKSRGDIRKLLTNLESQFYKIEEEYNRRKISTYRDRLLLYIVMFAVLFVGYSFFKSNPQVENFYLGTTFGKSLLMLFTVLYALGLYMSMRITRFKY